MTERLRGGIAKPIEPGMLARFGQRLRATYEVWFGPLLPLPQVAPADTGPRAGTAFLFCAESALLWTTWTQWTEWTCRVVVLVHAAHSIAV